MIPESASKDPIPKQEASESLDKAITSCNVCGDNGSDSESDADWGSWQDELSAAFIAHFWARVNKNGPVPAHRPDLGPCWLWTKNTVRGYGQLVLPRDLYGKQPHIYAHRFAYELTFGRLPSRKIKACHHCDEPLCCRGSHMFAGTQQDNLSDARAKGRLDESRPRTKVFTPEERLHIFRMHARRGLVASLARQYGVSKASISHIRRGRFAREKPAARRSA